MGCAAGLDEKLNAESERDKKQDETYGAQVTALIVRNGAEIDKYVADHWGKTGSRTTRQSGSRSAYNAGVTDGRNTDIYKPIGESTKKATAAVQLLG